MNHTKRTKAVMLAAIMAMLQSTCYAGAGMSIVDGQQEKENQVNFRWEAVNQDAKKLAVENPPVGVTAEKAVPIIITAADVDAMQKKRNRPQNAAVSPSTPTVGLETPDEKMANGSGGLSSSDGTEKQDTTAGAKNMGMQNPFEKEGNREAFGAGAYADGSGPMSSGTETGNRAYGKTDATMGGHSAVDDTDSDLKIYPLNGVPTVGAGKTPENPQSVPGGKVAALPEVEPIAKVVPLPPVQPVGAKDSVAREKQAAIIVELPPIEEVAQNSLKTENKTVELPSIQPVN